MSKNLVEIIKDFKTNTVIDVECIQPAAFPTVLSWRYLKTRKWEKIVCNSKIFGFAAYNCANFQSTEIVVCHTTRMVCLGSYVEKVFGFFCVRVPVVT